MHYFILLTDECNLCCEYCRGKIFTIDSCIDHEYGCNAESDSDSECRGAVSVNIDEDLPCDFAPPLETLYNFLRQD
ncbi:MAG: hypothetical protein J5703_03300, partial [Methanomicrobium sp.]|nr:hypothetical protein [Methanomicrobium sp.]